MDKYAKLRDKAKQIIKEQGTENLAIKTNDLDKLIEELQIYHIELEHQNEELQKTAQELEKTKNKYQNLYKHSPSSYITIDENFVVHNVNSAFCKMAKLHQAEIENKKITHFIQPHAQDAFYLLIRNALKNPNELISDFISFKTGNDSNYCKTQVITTGNGKNKEVRIAVTDVTKEREQDIKIIEEKEIWKKTFESVGEGIFILDENFTVLKANKTFASILGKTIDEVLGEKSYELIHGKKQHDNCSTCIAILKRSFSKREYFEKHLNKYLEIKVEPVVDNNNKFRFSVLTLRDITEKKKIQLKNELSNSIISRSPAIGFRWKAQEKWPVEHITDNVYKILGYTKEDFYSQKISFQDIIHPDDIETVKKEVHTFSQDPTCRSFTHKPYRVKKKDGQYIWVEDNTYIERENDTITHYEGIISDISEKVMAKNERTKQNKKLQQKNDEYASLNEEYIAANEELKSQNDRIQAINEKLMENEEKFRKLVNQSTDMLLLHDLNGNIIEVNNRSVQQYGYNRDELLNMNIRDLDPGYNIREDKGNFWKKIKENEPHFFEARQKNKQGEVFPVEVALSKIKLQGKTYIMGLCRDISERVKSQEALKQSAERLELFFRQPLDGFFFMMIDEPVEWNEKTDKKKILDYVFAHQKITKVNQAMLGQYGFEESEMLGLTPNDFFQHNIEHGKELWQKMFDQGKLYTESNERRKDGSGIWVEGNYICIYDSKGRIAGHFGVQRDVTKRKKAEKELRFQSLLLENISDLVTATDLEGNITYVNEAECRMQGKSKEEILGMNVKEYGEDPGKGATQNDIINKTLSKGQWRGEVVNYTADGKEAIMDCRTQIIQDENGKPMNMVGISTDITGRKQYEKELIEKNKEYATLNEEYLSQNEELQTTMQELQVNAFKLKESEQRHVDIANSIPGAVYSFILHEDNKIETSFISKTAEDLFEKPVSQLTKPGLLFTNVHPDDVPMLKDSIKDAAQKVVQWNCEFRLMFNKGRAKWVRGAFNPRKLENGGILWNGVIWNITGYKKAEQQIKEHLDELKTISEISTQLNKAETENEVLKITGKKIHELNPGAYIVLSSSDVLNPETIRIRKHYGFGKNMNKIIQTFDKDPRRMGFSVHDMSQEEKEFYTAGELTELENGIYTLLTGKFSKTLCNALGKILKVNKIYTMGFSHKDQPKGGITMLVKHGHEIRKKDIIESIVKQASISLEQVHYKEALEYSKQKTEESEAKFREFAEMLPETVFEINKNYKITFINKPGLRKLGFTIEDFKKGIDITQCFDGKEKEKLVDTLERGFSGSKTSNKEYLVKRKDGKEFPTVLFSAPVKQYKQITGFRGILTDIADIKNTEKLRNEKTLAEKTAKLKEQLLANISHEMRTPMNGIIGMTDFLNDTNLNAQQQEHVNTIKESSESLLHIINDVLDLSKIEQEKVQLNPQNTDIYLLLKNTINIFKGQAHQKGLKLQYHIDEKFPRFLFIDKNRFRQVLYNLISNAVKYTKFGHVNILFTLVKKSGKQLTGKVIVSDSGIGISEANKERIFDAFTRIESGYTYHAEGTGLGLPITKKLVEMFGGQLHLESTFGKGSEFSFTFIAKISDSQKIDTKKEAIPDIKDYNLEILLAEDKKVNQKVAKLLLENNGCTVTIAQNGKEALEIFKQDTFDIILMDIMMPEMDGVQAMKELRKTHKKLPPIIALTAHAMEGDASKFIELGMDDYIIKPIDKNELVKKLYKWTTNNPRSG